MDLKTNLRAEMEYTETTVKELAYKTGISQSTLNNYLGKNDVHPTIENGVKIARALGISAERLVYSEEPADTKEAREAIEILRKMSPKRQAQILKHLKLFPPD